VASEEEGGDDKEAEDTYRSLVQLFRAQVSRCLCYGLLFASSPSYLRARQWGPEGEQSGKVELSLAATPPIDKVRELNPSRGLCCGERRRTHSPHRHSPPRAFAFTPREQALLTTESCFVLDCGSEVFVWTGKKSPVKLRNATLKKAQVSVTVIALRLHSSPLAAHLAN
jgi:hypothetical protein